MNTVSVWCFGRNQVKGVTFKILVGMGQPQDVRDSEVKNPAQRSHWREK